MSVSRLVFCFHILVVLLACSAGAIAQTAPPSRIMGEVTSKEPTQLTVKTDKGEVSITVTEKTRYLRIKPGETDATKAVKITSSDLGNGDRVLALGKLSED